MASDDICQGKKTYANSLFTSCIFQQQSKTGHPNAPQNTARICKGHDRTLCQKSCNTKKKKPRKYEAFSMGAAGLEPATSRV